MIASELISALFAMGDLWALPIKTHMTPQEVN